MINRPRSEVQNGRLESLLSRVRSQGILVVAQSIS
jgi:hypothetical protein